MRVWQVYCGNPDCRHRASEHLFTVTTVDYVEGDEIPAGCDGVLPLDGSVWVCSECQVAMIDR